MIRTRLSMITLVLSILAVIGTGVSHADTTMVKGTGLNQSNPDLLDVWVQSSHQTPVLVGTPVQGIFEFRPAASYPCNYATESGQFTNVPAASASTATVLERRYVSSGTVQGTPFTIVGSTVEYVIQDGPPQAKGVTIRRLDWESSGKTGSTFSYYRNDPNLGTPYFFGHAEGDINGILRFVGYDGAGHAITETRRTSVGGVQDTSVSTVVWDNPVINVVESEVVHTGVLVYTVSGSGFQYTRSDECIPASGNLVQQAGESFYLPAYNVGHYRGSWQDAGTLDHGLSFSYVYNRTDSTEVVPRVIGLLRVSAQNLITDNGFTPGTVTTAFSSVYPAGRVISQSVIAGNLATRGTAINLVVSDGPAPAAPPCACDLTRDGRCDMRDWLLFGQRWGAANCNVLPCACDLTRDGRCDMRDWLIFGASWGRTNCPVFNNAILAGVWMATASDNQSAQERPYLIADGAGNLTDFGAFDVNPADPGHYNVNTDGSFILYGESPSSPWITGRLTSVSSMILPTVEFGVPTTMYAYKVTDRSLCAGTWIGTINQFDGTVRQISFTVDSAGIVTSFSGFAGPVSGKMFSVNGQVSSFFRTGEPVDYDQFTIVGTLSGNTIKGLFLPDATDYNGAIQLVRQ